MAWSPGPGWERVSPPAVAPVESNVEWTPGPGYEKVSGSKASDSQWNPGSEYEKVQPPTEDQFDPAFYNRNAPSAPAAIEQVPQKSEQEIWKDVAKEELDRSLLPGLRSTLIGIGGSVASQVARVTGQGEKADILNRWAQAFNDAQTERENESNGIIPAIVKRGLRGVGTTLPQAIVAAPLGPYAMIGQAFAQETNQAVTEGRDAGKSGGELFKYAATQGAIEGGVAALFQKVGLGGMESVVGGKLAAATGMSSALKRLGITTAQELPEEVIIELGHNVARASFDVNPDATSPEQIAQTVADVTVQTLLTMGAVNVPNMLKSAFKTKEVSVAPTVDEAIKQEIIATGESGGAPTRPQWRKWFGDDTQVGSAAWRRDSVAQWAKDYKSMPVEQTSQQPIETVSAESTGEQAQPTSTETKTKYEQALSELGDVSEETDASSAKPVASSPDVVGISNQVVNDLRAARNLPAIEKPEPESFDQWIAAANKRTVQDRANLIGELQESPRPTTDEETAALVIHYRELQNTYAQKSESVLAAQQSGDSVAVERAQAEANVVDSQLKTAEEVFDKVGTEAGRAFVARKIGLLADYSIAGMARRLRVAKGGAELSEAENATISALSKQVADLQMKLTDRTDNIGVDAAIESMVPRRKILKAQQRSKIAKEQFKAAWDELKSALAEGVGEKPSAGNLTTGESGALNVKAVAASMKLAKAFFDLGTSTFNEFFAHAQQALGDTAMSIKNELRESWNSVSGGKNAVEFDPADPKSISHSAKKIVRSLVEAGMRDRDSIVSATHEELAAIDPSITKRQTMDAISGYGQYAELSKDEISVVIRDINGQLQQLAKLDDMDAGNNPQKTGYARRTPSDTERHLIQQVNEARKKFGFIDTESSIKSALGAAKTALRNRITDLETEIASGKRIVDKKTVLIPDKELSDLRAKRDELRVEHDRVFGKTELTDEQRAALASKALDRSIKSLEDDLASGNIGVKTKRGVISMPELDAKRDRLGELRDKRDDLREAANPSMTKEEKLNAAYKRALKKRLDDLNTRIQNKDFSKKVVNHRTLDDESIGIKYQIKLRQDVFNNMEDYFKREQRSKITKALDLIPQGLNFSRALLTSMDLSAMLRQGAFTTASHPILSAKAIPEMLSAFASKEAAFKSAEKIQMRANARFADQCKLAVTLVDGPISKQEEMYYGKWAQYVPGVAGSERAYVTFLNKIRADVFDSLCASLAQSGKPTVQEGKAIANFVNVATGRGSMGPAAPAANFLANVFFAPRYAVSRFQLLLAQPAWGGTARTRVLVAKEYGRALIGAGVFYATLLLYNQFQDDEKEKFKFETDPRSSDFMKPKIGNTRIDPLAGLSQVTAFLSRVISGTTKNKTGEIAKIRTGFTLKGKEKEFGGMSSAGAFGQLLRSKLAPITGTGYDVIFGNMKNPVGEPITPKSLVASNVVPLSFRDIYSVMSDQGLPKGTALSLLTLFGMGIQTYQGATADKFATQIAKHARVVEKNKNTKEIVDHSDEISQVVAQAKRLGISEDDMVISLRKKMKSDGHSKAIDAWVERLRRRYRRAK